LNERRDLRSIHGIVFVARHRDRVAVELRRISFRAARAALEFLAEQNPPVTVVPDAGAVKALGLALCGDTTTIKVPGRVR
jgi:hypothetical protein